MSDTAKTNSNDPNAPKLTTLVPPHNTAIEQALLASLMNIEDAYDAISDIVEKDDFYHDNHANIFETIAHLSHKKQPYDVLSVYDSLARQERLQSVGGEEYLMKIEQGPGTLFNLNHYAEKVREMSIYRRLIKTGNTILNLAYHPKEQSVDEILNIAESEIFQISAKQKTTQGTQGLKTIQTVLGDVVDTLETLKYAPKDVLLGLDTSFIELNNKTQGLQRGDLIILAARPSMGKTSLALNLVQSVLHQELPVLMFSMEMGAQAIVMRLLSAWGKINLGKLRTAKMTPDEWNSFNSGFQMLESSKLYIDDRNNLSPNEVRSVCRKIGKNGKLGLIVVDYLQLMKVPSLEGNRVAEISEISRSLKALAREMDCPVLALSQLNRSLESRPNKRPVMSDLRESGAIEQDADVIMFIYRDEVYNKERSDNKGKAELIIGKNRNGPIGDVPLHFQGQYTRFDNPIHSDFNTYDFDDTNDNNDYDE